MLPGLSFLDPSSGYRKLALILGLLLLVVVVGLGACWWGYGQGFDKAEALGKAEIKTLEAGYAKAGANATAEAMQTTVRLAKRGNELAFDLITTRSELATARAAITRRINDVAQTVPAACVFGPEYVGLRNDAFYGVHSNTAANATDPGGAQSRPGEAGRVRSGVRGVASVADSLTWDRDMGTYVRSLEDVSAARLKLLEAWAQ
jgi:hypothetical protein